MHTCFDRAEAYSFSQFYVDTAQHSKFYVDL